MINKLVVDGQNITLNESTVLPFTYTFSTAGVHTVRVGLDNTNEICAYAFKDCENLTKVNSIPEKITMIKRNAFENCTNLTSFNVPSSIEYVGPNVFDGCIALKEIKFNTNNPPKFFSNLDNITTCYIPDGAKYIKVEDNSELVKDGSVQYYEKNILGGYDEIDFEALEDDGEYYYDNWTTVHDHYNVVEERFRIKPTQIEFLDNGTSTTLYGDINAGDEGDIFEHHLIPDNCTNPNVFIYSTNENVLQVDQNGHFTTYAGLLGNTNVNVCICTEPDYNGTYAFTQLRFRVRSTQVITEKVDMSLEFDFDELNVSEANIGDVIEFNAPVLNGDNTLINPTITYSSSNTDVVNVVNGVLKVVGNGTTTITATYAGDVIHKAATSTFDITVTIAKQDVHITFENSVVNIEGEVGDTITIQEATCDYEDAELEYTYNHNNVINIENDVITIAKEGTIIVTATYAGDELHNAASAQYTINITLAEVEEPEISDNLFYIGQTLPTNENIEELDTEEIGEWTEDSRKTIDMSELTKPTTYYIMVPLNHNAPIVHDPNENVMTSEKLEAIDNYDIYEYELGKAIYTLYFE